MVFQLISIRRQINVLNKTIDAFTPHLTALEDRLKSPKITENNREKWETELNTIKDQIDNKRKSLAKLQRETTKTFAWLFGIAIGLVALLYWIFLYLYGL